MYIFKLTFAVLFDIHFVQLEMQFFFPVKTKTSLIIVFHQNTTYCYHLLFEYFKVMLAVMTTTKYKVVVINH